MINVAKSAPYNETAILRSGQQSRKVKTDMRDAYLLVKEYLGQPKVKRPDYGEDGEWLERERIFKMAYLAVSKLVVREARIVACTNNLAGTDIVRRNFGNESKIVVIADEDGQAIESDAIIPLVSLDNAKNVVGTIRRGDRHQLGLRAVTAAAESRYNDFGPQISQSLLKRLLSAGWPAVVLRNST